MNLLSSYTNDDILEEAINRGLTDDDGCIIRCPSWLQVFPKESELSIVDVDNLNAIIAKYCTDNGIHKNG